MPKGLKKRDFAQMIKKAKWIIAPENEEKIITLQKDLGISHLAACVLSARGWSVSDAESFMGGSFDDISDPFLIADMDKAVELLQKAIKNGEKIAVYGDYDVDGITATCILIHYLKSKGADCRYYIPDRINEGYGLNKCAIAELAEEGITLLVTVDSGITAVEETEYAKSLGMKVVITDHHECKTPLPQADAVVNPRRSDSAHPFRELAGVGVAFKLICAMERDTGIKELLDEYADIVALGTVADVMPLKGENRIIVTEGLKNIRHTGNIGLKALMKRLGLDGKPVTANTVSFVLAPRINAAGRLGEAGCTARLLLTDDCQEACELSERLCDLNRRRQETENDIYTQILSMIQEDPTLIQGKMMVLWGENWHTGVIGIVSSRLSDRYGMPCVMISMCGDIGKGSGRSIQGFNLYDALSRCSDILDRFGGHELAVGLAIKRENLQELKRRLMERAEETLRDCEQEPVLEVDYVARPEDLSVQSVKSLSVLEPFGMGNPTPLFVLKDAGVEEITPISHERHVKMLLSCGGHNFCSMVFGMGAGRCPFVKGDQVDLVFSAEVNYFRGRESVQLIAKDIRWSEKDISCDKLSKDRYDRFLRGERLSREEALSLCPCRDDLVAVFRHVKANAEEHRLCGRPCTIYRKIKYESKCCMNQGRFLVCMDILREFDIFDYSLDGERMVISDLEYKGKADINGSRILKKLMDVIKG